MVILLQSLHSGQRKEFVINKPEDFEPIFEEFPLVRRITESATSLRRAAELAVKYLSGHNMNAWIEDDQFQKSIRGAIAGLGMLVLVPNAMSGTHTVMAPTRTPQGVQSNSFVKPFGTQREDRFLGNISLLESSGGKNIQHGPVKHGPYRGERAIGKWGILPTTIQEILSRQKKLGTLRPEVAPLQSMNRDQMAVFLHRNPHIELHLARHLARHVLYRHGGNAAKAAYGWKYGHNLGPADIDPNELAGSQYVKDFLNLNAGKPVRGLKPAMPRPATALVAKAEEPNFLERVKAWVEAREADVRESFPKDTTRSPDPGRIKEDDEFKEKTPKSTHEILQHAIEDAKRARKS